MTASISASSFRRSDWDLSGRTRPMVDVMLGQLAKAPSAEEREDIVFRLTRYLSQFPEEQVDIARVNAAFARAGFAPLPGTNDASKKRPLSQMPPETLAAFQRSEQFHGREVANASAGLSPQKANAIAQVSALVRQTCGDLLSADELATALEMLRLAR